MKIKIVIALILSLSTQVFLSAKLLKIGPVQEKNVARTARQVGQLLCKHHVVKISLIVISSIANLVEFYRCCQFFYNKFSSSITSECFDDHELICGKFEQKTEKSNSLIRVAMQVVVGIKNLLISKESCYALLLGSSAMTTQKFMADVNHPHTITWFTYKKVPYKRIFDQVHEYAQLLDRNTLDHEKGIYYKQTLNSLCNQVVECIEQLCGFMLYKKTRLEKAKQKKVQSIICYLARCTHTWGREVNKLFNQDFFDPQKFIELTKDFKEGLQREISHFACVEKETPIDVLQIISMHKQL